MNLGDPWVLFSGMLIGAVGLFLFVRGKREADFTCLGAGAAMCVYPYFVGSLAVMWGLFALCVGGLYWASKRA